jgi:S1-C subfamily serine protease
MRRWAALAVVVLAGCGDDATAPEVVPVRVSREAATAFSAGAGRAVTVAHVLQAGRAVTAGGRPARVVHVDRRLDIAVLAVRGGAPLARAGAARAGERVTVRVLRTGGARSLDATVRRAITARVSGTVRPALELAAAVEPGDSGAPVLDGDGRVVGVVFAQAAGDDALAYALDARALSTVLAP